MNESWRGVLEALFEEALSFGVPGMPPLLMREDVVERLGETPEALPEAVIRARITRALMQYFRAKLRRSPRFNQRFVHQVEWRWLHKLLVAARLKELAQVKIVRHGRRGGMRFDITELIESYHGRQICLSLGLENARRRMVDAETIKRLRGAFDQIKLALPEAIQPTTTERFFAEAGSVSEGSAEG